MAGRPPISAETSAQEQEQEKAKRTRTRTRTQTRTMTKSLLVTCVLLGFLIAQFSFTRNLSAYRYHNVFEEVPVVRRSDPASPTPTSTSISTSTSTSKKPAKTFQLYHVMNIYATKRDNNTDDIIRQPYDQWVTLQSIERAKQFMPRALNMTLVCAFLESDMKVLTPERVPQCDRRILLERSTVTEYGLQSLKGKNIIDDMDRKVAEYFESKELPFMQDILDAAVSVAREHQTADHGHDEKEDFYIMLTNADIGLTKHFYSFLLNQLKKRRKAFTINRMTIPMYEGDWVDTPEQIKWMQETQELTSKQFKRMQAKQDKLRLKAKPPNITIREPTNNQADIDTLLEQIEDAMPAGKKHPGSDLFVMHSSIIDGVHMGDQFAGFSPVAGVLKMTLRDIVAKGDYVMIPSSIQGSFHLGDERTWMKSVPPETRQLFVHMKTKLERKKQSCPMKRVSKNPHTLLNMANCGDAFLEHYSIFRKQVKSGICPHGPMRGWFETKYHFCEDWRKGKRTSFPWVSVRMKEKLERKQRRKNVKSA